MPHLEMKATQAPQELEILLQVWTFTLMKHCKLRVMSVFDNIPGTYECQTTIIDPILCQIWHLKNVPYKVAVYAHTYLVKKPSRWLLSQQVGP